jgi:tetratricopeptide (TPR) repeat protein
MRIVHRLIPLACLLACAAAPVLAESGQTPLDQVLAQDAALAPLRAVVEAEPGKACAWNEIGKSLARRAFFEEAQEAFERSVQLADDPVAWNNLGSLHLTRGQYGAARSAIQKAIALDPNFALAWYDLGAVDQAQLHYEGAVKNYKRAFELDPKLADPMLNPAIVNNIYMTAIRTMLYQETVGALSLPLGSTCGGAAAAGAPPAASAPAHAP